MISINKRWLGYVKFLYRYRFLFLIITVLLGGLSFRLAGAIELKTRIQDMLPADNPIVDTVL